MYMIQELANVQKNYNHIHDGNKRMKLKLERTKVQAYIEVVKENSY